ncbi:MAG: hypothetical protein SGPRY_004483 [Prymnesium sp.]
MCGAFDETASRGGGVEGLSEGWRKMREVSRASRAAPTAMVSGGECARAFLAPSFASAGGGEGDGEGSSQGRAEGEGSSEGEAKGG